MEPDELPEALEDWEEWCTALVNEESEHELSYWDFQPEEVINSYSERRGV